jgi:hypothetical protein
MAQQPYMGSGLLFPGFLGCAHSWQLVTGQLAALLFYPSWCDRQSHLAGSQETWVRNDRFEFSLRNISLHARKILLHAVNLRHGTDGFTSPPKEVVLRIFITLTVIYTHKKFCLVVYYVLLILVWNKSSTLTQSRR